MQGTIIISIIVFIISFALKSEKKKKEALTSQQNFLSQRNGGRPKRVHYGAPVRKSNEQNILEKAAMNTVEANLSYKEPKKAEDVYREDFYEEKPLFLGTVKNPFIAEPVNPPEKTERFEMRYEMPKKEFAAESFSDFETEDEDRALFRKEVFDGFGASDALYLARKDAREGRDWI